MRVVAVLLVLVAASASTACGRAARPDGLGQVEAEWRANLAAGARADRAQRFANPSRAVLDARLAAAARRYRFAVVSVRILRPRQAAPRVVIRADDERSLVASVPAILRLVDPKARTGDDRTGWAYEGFLLEALDRHGVPVLATFNWWRGPHAGGGQWAARPELHPFPHG